MSQPIRFSRDFDVEDISLNLRTMTALVEVSRAALAGQGKVAPEALAEVMCVIASYFDCVNDAMEPAIEVIAAQVKALRFPA